MLSPELSNVCGYRDKVILIMKSCFWDKERGDKKKDRIITRRECSHNVQRKMVRKKM